ncbi:MAG: Tim44 domain-containing protein [Candidimonas sp.]|nr:MAG: Tim44 domain-containing protein [Candidimonas sp.]
MSPFLSRSLAAAMLLVASLAMLTVSSDVEARRLGGGGSFGRQSQNITQHRQAVPPPAAKAPAGAAASGQAASGARAGGSRWFGPLAGIAAGLGIAALLSHLGLSGAFLEAVSSLLLIGLALAAILFLVRRMQGRVMASARVAQGLPSGAQTVSRDGPSRQPAIRPLAANGVSPVDAPAAVDSGWFIPEDFDTPTFLAEAKKQFAAVQAIWDTGNTRDLSGYLTDDLMAEIAPQVEANHGRGATEVVLLNAELLGIEAVEGGHLASVRYSGMLREDGRAEAFRFQEVWNLYKSNEHGWLLAGIQQLPV